MSKKLLKVDEYIKDPFPNPNPTSFHGKWTDWPDEHNQKSLNKKGVYVLRDKGAVPDGGKPFFVEQTHPADGGDARVTLDMANARKFRGTYLLRTMWNWERWFTADPA